MGIEAAAKRTQFKGNSEISNLKFTKPKPDLAITFKERIINLMTTRRRRWLLGVEVLLGLTILTALLWPRSDPYGFLQSLHPTQSTDWSYGSAENHYELRFDFSVPKDQVIACLKSRWAVKPDRHPEDHPGYLYFNNPLSEFTEFTDGVPYYKRGVTCTLIILVDKPTWFEVQASKVQSQIDRFEYWAGLKREPYTPRLIM